MIKQKNDLKILLISGIYPSARRPMSGVFVRNQAILLEQTGAAVGLLVARGVVPLLSLFFERFAPVSDKDECEDAYKIGRKTVFRSIFPLHSLFSLTNAMFYRAIYKTALDWHREVKFDVVIANGVTPAGYSAVKIAKELGLPSSIYAIGSDLNCYTNYSRKVRNQTCWALSNTDMVLTVNRKLVDRIKQLHLPQRLDTLYYGCNLSKFKELLHSKKNLRMELGLPEKTDILCFVGGIRPIKGINELWEAFVVLKQSHPKIHLLLVGDGPLAKPIRQKAVDMGLSNALTITGYVPEEQVCRWLSASDLFVLPSHDEGMPMALIEAMAMRLCVVASTVGGIPEIVEDGISGRLVPSKDAETLCTVLREMIDNYQQREQMALTGQHIVRERFDALVNARKLRNLLCKLKEEFHTHRGCCLRRVWVQTQRRSNRLPPCSDGRGGHAAQ